MTEIKELLKKAFIKTIIKSKGPNQTIVNTDMYLKALVKLDEKCVWKKDDNGDCHTSCPDLDKPVNVLKKFTRIFHYCPFCGKEIKEVK